ncbi:MAG: hypothetical protein KC413_02080, partial [Anaerolineales bacterium]|nr:hypothetical protein [Anaerolineales bacterium]
LRGKVLPIGGLKAKTIAAHRAGIKTVLLPADNAKDIPELPDRIREDLNLITASHLDEVLEIALLEPVGPPFAVESTGTDGEKAPMPPPVSKGGVGERPLRADTPTLQKMPRLEKRLHPDYT